jgi:hypothetical protein
MTVRMFLGDFVNISTVTVINLRSKWEKTERKKMKRLSF